MRSRSRSAGKGGRSEKYMVASLPFALAGPYNYDNDACLPWEFRLQLPIRYPNMPQLLLKARDSLLQHFRPILNHFGVTEQQWRIMRALNESPTLEPRELCDICQISSPSMSGILARMEEIGLIGRSKFEGDQRRRKVHLSEAGASLLLQMGKLIDLQYENLEAAYGKQVFEDMRRTLEAFIALETLPVAPAILR